MKVIQDVKVCFWLLLIAGQVEGENGFDRPLPLSRGELRINVLQKARQFVVGGIVVQIRIGEQPVEFLAGGEVHSERQRLHTEAAEKRYPGGSELLAPPRRGVRSVAGEPLQAVVRGVDQYVDMTVTKALLVGFDGIAAETVGIPVRMRFLPREVRSVPGSQMCCNGRQQVPGDDVEAWLESALPEFVQRRVVVMLGQFEFDVLLRQVEFGREVVIEFEERRLQMKGVSGHGIEYVEQRLEQAGADAALS